MTAPRDDQVARLVDALPSKDRVSTRLAQAVTASDRELKIVAEYPTGEIVCAEISDNGLVCLGTWYSTGGAGTVEGITPERRAAKVAARARASLVDRKNGSGGSSP